MGNSKGYDEQASAVFKDFEQRQLQTSFGTTRVYTFGDKSLPTVFLFHGMRGSSLEMAWAVPALRESKRIVVVDYICDIGRSEPKTAPTSAADHAVWVKELCDGVGVTPGAKVSFIGYSYGSFLAATTALEVPELVERLILIAPAATLGSFTYGFITRIIASILLKSCGFNFTWVYKKFTAPDFDVKRALSTSSEWQMMEVLSDADPVNDLNGLPRMKPTALSDPDLKKLRELCPVSLLMPEFESVVEPKQAMSRARTAGWDVFVIPNTGHAASLEKPQWLCDKVQEILKQ